MENVKLGNESSNTGLIFETTTNSHNAEHISSDDESSKTNIETLSAFKFCFVDIEPNQFLTSIHDPIPENPNKKNPSKEYKFVLGNRKSANEILKLLEKTPELKDWLQIREFAIEKTKLTTVPALSRNFDEFNEFSTSAERIVMEIDPLSNSVIISPTGRGINMFLRNTAQISIFTPITEHVLFPFSFWERKSIESFFPYIKIDPKEESQTWIAKNTSLLGLFSEYFIGNQNWPQNSNNQTKTEYHLYCETLFQFLKNKSTSYVPQSPSHETLLLTARFFLIPTLCDSIARNDCHQFLSCEIPRLFDLMVNMNSPPSTTKIYMSAILSRFESNHESLPFGLSVLKNDQIWPLSQTRFTDYIEGLVGLFLKGTLDLKTYEGTMTASHTTLSHFLRNRGGNSNDDETDKITKNAKKAQQYIEILQVVLKTFSKQFISCLAKNQKGSAGNCLEVLVKQLKETELGNLISMFPTKFTLSCLDPFFIEKLKSINSGVIFQALMMNFK